MHQSAVKFIKRGPFLDKFSIFSREMSDLDKLSISELKGRK